MGLRKRLTNKICIFLFKQFYLPQFQKLEYEQQSNDTNHALVWP
jgi:hypothetical protein